MRLRLSSRYGRSLPTPRTDPGVRVSAPGPDRRCLTANRASGRGCRMRVLGQNLALNVCPPAAR